MTLEELQRSLPNGLHDSILRRLVVDYRAGSALLDVEIDMQENRSAAPRYQRAWIALSGLVFIAIEPPSQGDGSWPPSGLVVDAGPGSRSQLPPTSKGVFVHWIYVMAWNSFIHVAATDATIEWDNSLSTST